MRSIVLAQIDFLGLDRGHGRRPLRFPHLAQVLAWRGGRVVDGSGLENRRSESFRGFESHPLRSNDHRKLKLHQGV